MAVIERPACAVVRKSESEWVADLVFDAQAAYFQGHFPEFSVLPGVAQLGLAQTFAAEVFGLTRPLTTVKKMKFTRPIVPGECVRLTLTRKSEVEVVYEFRKEATPCSSGVLCF